MRFKILSLIALGAVVVVHGQDKNDQVGNLGGSINPPAAIVLGTLGSVTYTVIDSAVQSLSLLLCQSSVNAQDPSKRDIKPLLINNFCVNVPSTSSGGACSSTVELNKSFTVYYGISADADVMASPSSTTFYFFCLAPTGGDCGPHSTPFNINQISSFPIDQAQIPQAPISLLYGQSPGLSLAPTSTGAVALPTTSATGSISYSLATVTAPTAAPTNTASGDDSDQTPKSSGGLSIGAKVGIAIAAAVALIIFLLLALFFLRRKHQKRGAAGQVMLNQSLNGDSRDLITEKEISAGSLNSPAPTFSTIPSTSHARNNSLSPYEPAPSRPYSGLAAAVPRRSPTASAFPKGVTDTATTRDASAVVGGAAAATTGGAAAEAAAAAPTTGIARGASNASSAIISPRSTTVSLLEDSNFEEFRDVAIYGDARHSPQVYPGENGSQQASHLGQSSDYTTYAAVSAEDEAARLREEEEERRIDAAIAEADLAAQHRMI